MNRTSVAFGVIATLSVAVLTRPTPHRPYATLNSSLPALTPIATATSPGRKSLRCAGRSSRGLIATVMVQWMPEIVRL